MAIKTVYLIGSLRNERIPEIGKLLRAEAGLDIFDDWYSAGPHADDCWQAYETKRGTHYGEALNGWAARNVFEFDKRHLDRCGGVILALPAGKSGHLELGYAIGCGKPGAVLFDQVPERWDVMYQFATAVYFDIKDLIADIRMGHIF